MCPSFFDHVLPVHILFRAGSPDEAELPRANGCGLSARGNRGQSSVLAVCRVRRCSYDFLWGLCQNSWPGGHLGTSNQWPTWSWSIGYFRHQFRLAKAEAGTGNAMHKSKVEWHLGNRSTGAWICCFAFAWICCAAPLKSCVFCAWLLLYAFILYDICFHIFPWHVAPS